MFHQQYYIIRGASSFLLLSQSYVAIFGIPDRHPIVAGVIGENLDVGDLLKRHGYPDDNWFVESALEVVKGLQQNPPMTAMYSGPVRVGTVNGALLARALNTALYMEDEDQVHFLASMFNSYDDLRATCEALIRDRLA